MNHNISNDTPDYNKVLFDANTLQIKYSLPIQVDVLKDVQHDGHLWSEDDIEDAEADLLDIIMGDLRKIIEKHISNSKPFAVHI